MPALPAFDDNQRAPTLQLPAPLRLPARRATAPTTMPDLDIATADDILDLAANALRITEYADAVADSPPHLTAILRQIERLDCDLTVRDERIAELIGGHDLGPDGTDHRLHRTHVAFSIDARGEECLLILPTSCVLQRFSALRGVDDLLL
jgi:hypothetical protein